MHELRRLHLQLRTREQRQQQRGGPEGDGHVHASRGQDAVHGAQQSRHRVLGQCAVERALVEEQVRRAIGKKSCQVSVDEITLAPGQARHCAMARVHVRDAADVAIHSQDVCVSRGRQVHWHLGGAAAQVHSPCSWREPQHSRWRQVGSQLLPAHDPFKCPVLLGGVAVAVVRHETKFDEALGFTSTRTRRQHVHAHMCRKKSDFVTQDDETDVT